MFKIKELKILLLELETSLTKEFEKVLTDKTLVNSLTKIFKFYKYHKSVAGMEISLNSFSEYNYFQEVLTELFFNKQNFPNLKKHLLEMFKEDFSKEDYRFFELEKENISFENFFDKVKSIQNGVRKNITKINKDLIPEKLFYKTFKKTKTDPSKTGIDTQLEIKPTPKNKIKQFQSAEILLKEIWEEGYDLYKTLTFKINFIQSKDLVSYSHFGEQGISYINIIDRSLIETVDDLIHENSHHHLNLIIKKYDPFKIQLTDEIFYSPWRKELRPIYAILHAVFTFSFGAKLFLEMTQKIPLLSKKFTDEEISFIYRRFSEETIMVNYSLVDLKYGIKKKYFTLKGIELISELEKMNSECLKFSKKLDTKKLSKTDSKKISELKLELTKARKTYKL